MSKQISKSDIKLKYITRETTTAADDVAVNTANPGNASNDLISRKKKKSKKKQSLLTGSVTLKESLKDKIEKYIWIPDDEDEKNLTESLSVDDVLNMYGGEDFFEEKFKSARKAVEYIFDNLDDLLNTFNIEEKDIPKNKIFKRLKELIGK